MNALASYVEIATGHALDERRGSDTSGRVLIALVCTPCGIVHDVRFTGERYDADATEYVTVMS